MLSAPKAGLAPSPPSAGVKELGSGPSFLVSRRRFQIGALAASLLPASQLLAGCGAGAAAGSDDQASATAWRMADEGAPHRRTWMAWGASAAIWGDMLPDVRNALVRIANAIAGFEPVSMLVRPGEIELLRPRVAAGVELVPTGLDDLWMRDIGCVFVKSADGRRGGIDFNFNGWGDRQAHAADAGVAEFTAARAGVEPVETTLVMEGGGIEVDGSGTALLTESCILNANRNPGVTKAQAERELARLLGITRFIWLPGIKDKDITDAHIDFYARFAGPGVVVAHLTNDTSSYEYDMTRRHLDILRASTDAQGRPLDVVTLSAPDSVRPAFDGDEFAAGYINYYLVNGGLIAPQFGDARADAAALATLQRLYPRRRIVQLDIDPIAGGGGGIHCTTQQEPL